MSRRDEHARGSAQVAAGSVAAGTGLIAGGIPGAKEPQALGIFRLKGQGQDRMSRSNVLHNGKVVAPQLRAGVLGFRASMHDAFITENQHKTNGTAYVRGMRQGKLQAEHKIVRGMRLGRRGSYAATVGGGALAAVGARRMKQNEDRRVTKQDNRRSGSAAALAGGASVATVGHVVPAVLRNQERKYSSSAKGHVRAAQKLAPHYGGLETLPAKYGAFAEVRRPARETMYPARTDHELKATSASRKIKGGAQVAAEVGRHRGMAAQHRHFAEAFGSTAKVVRGFRNPGLAVAGAGGAGLWAVQPHHKNVHKSEDLEMHERRVSPVRATGAVAGAAALSYAAPRMLGRTLVRGSNVASVMGRRGTQMSLLRGEALRQAAIRRTAGMGGVTRAPYVGPLARAVPQGSRNLVAGVAGVELLRRSTPIHRDHYRPATAADVTGW